MSLKRRHSPSPPSSGPSSATTTTTTSHLITDRASTFLAHFSASLPAKEIQSLSSLATATHRIAAWRHPSSQRTLSQHASSVRKLYETGHDDDGEAHAGKRLERLLSDMRVEGAVVVARWYGGVMLGPVRFTHIEAVARDAIRKAAVAPACTPITPQEDDDCDRRRLGRVLEERDRSIRALRGLLREKMDDPGGVVQEAKEMGYGKMGVQVLKKLEVARDGTIAWLLKEIDRVEAAALEKWSEKRFVENKGQDRQIEKEHVKVGQFDRKDEDGRPRAGEEQAKYTEAQGDGEEERCKPEADRSKHVSPQNEVMTTNSAVNNAQPASAEPTAPND